MQQKKYKIKNLTQLNEFAFYILQNLNSKKIISLQGDLGAGKTALSKCIAKHLNIQIPVLSPTFTIFNVYQIHNNLTFDTLCHIDAYRLNENSIIINDIGIEDYLKSTKTLCLIEWPENIKNTLLLRQLTKQNQIFFIKIDYGKNEDERIISINDKIQNL